MASRYPYLNNKNGWPEGLWEEWGDPPPDERRCQFESDIPSVCCGLPRHADDEEGNPRCIFHYEGERDAGELRSELESAVARNANLWGAKLQNADLFGVKLQNADLSNAKLRDANLGWTELQNADLRWAKLTGEVDLRGADLTEADLEDVEISPRAKLDGVEWGLDQKGRLKLEREADEMEDGAEKAEAFRQSEAVYRQIKLSYQESGDYQTAGDFFIREMQCQRLRLVLEARERKAVRAFERAFRWVMCATCRYGEEPKRLLGIMLLLVVVFAGLHMLAGFDQVLDGERVAVWHGLGWCNDGNWGLWYNGGLPRGRAVWKAVYFSVLNFTSLGHGDYQPTDAGTAVCVAEVALGVTLIALFMVCVARRFSR